MICNWRLATRPGRTALVLLLTTIGSQLPTVFAQGSLTPPGAPAPTMKSLDQIEPRTAITNTTNSVTILQPGSYYLTHNLTVSSGDGIDIMTNGVTLDLNGFTIRSTAPSAAGYGVFITNGSRNVTIANGFIQGAVTNNGSGVYSGSGFNFGIFYYPNGVLTNTRVSGVSISGCQIYGIYLGTGSSTVAESCTVVTIGGIGILASTIKNCSAHDCGSDAINGDEVSDSRGQSAGHGIGVYASNVQNSYGQSFSGYGLDAYTAQNSFGFSNTGVGLSAFCAQNCYGQSGASYGLSANTAQNCNGYSYGNGIGLFAMYSATGCYGYSASGTGVSALIANVCHGETSTGTNLNTSHNVNSY